MIEIVNKNNEPKVLKIKNKIYKIRGKDVMLDYDLADLYEVETKRINESVKNNLEKFPERFSFKLSNDESKNFLVENFDQKIETRGGKYKNPRAFTEQGIAMLSTILKSKVATKVSIQIMDAFVLMRHIIGSNSLALSNMQNMLIKHDNDIKKLQETFKDFKLNKNEIYFGGQVYDAYSKIVDIFKEAKKELIIIDGYADKTVLDMIKDLKVNIILITKTKSLLKSLDIQKYNKEYSNLSVIHNDNYHDRFFIIDKNKVYHCGTSINYAGKRTFAINGIEEKLLKEKLIESVIKVINKN